ncbi:tetratricopeptide repeat protein [Moritella sp. Urea-trap-13]|uniref:tetratricopeptide repeat protein n=1 Tax=Moritella sp. Urea-trap-13 TaxID=2058327 RepID=UPI000C32AAD3|nr:SEL1-like repeat protein [Moritella sp. Urea-trap-13]PKH04986.1 sel1 repeat family protein [Moritella sp. Urea-trap-13]
MLTTPITKLTTIYRHVKAVLCVVIASVSVSGVNVLAAENSGDSLISSMPVSSKQAASKSLASKPVGEKEQRITDSGKRAVAAEEAGNTKTKYSDFPSAVELYSDDELNQLIGANTHLQRVRADECQLVADIKVRAELVKLPSYQFLWGDMLAWGVCVDKNAELGVYFMRAAASQGQPRALEQLGRYYVQGQFVQQDIDRALPLFEQSAKLGFLPAKIQWAELLVRGYGSPYDYQTAYSYLYNTVTADAKMHEKLARLLAQLENRMPERVVIAAKNAAKYQ